MKEMLDLIWLMILSFFEEMTSMLMWLWCFDKLGLKGCEGGNSIDGLINRKLNLINWVRDHSRQHSRRRIWISNCSQCPSWKASRCRDREWAHFLDLVLLEAICSFYSHALSMFAVAGGSSCIWPSSATVCFDTPSSFAGDAPYTGQVSDLFLKFAWTVMLISLLLISDF